jgi:DNA-binding MarR family transcriptional regulator
MPKNDQISEIINLIFNIRQLMHEKLSGHYTKKVSFLQIITLRYIEEKRPLMKDIASYLAITPPSATSLVNSLIKSGLAKRESSKKDRRIVRIEITDSGKKNMKNNLSEVTLRMRKNLESLTKKEQEQLKKILKKAADSCVCNE